MGQMDNFNSATFNEDLTDTVEFEIPPVLMQRKKKLAFVENDVENGIIILNTTSCCFYKQSHNMPHDHFSISRGIQCGNGLGTTNNPLKMNSDYPNIPFSQSLSPYRHYQYPKNTVTNTDLIKPSTLPDCPMSAAIWDNIPSCPLLRDSEKFRKSHDEPRLNRSFTIDDNNSVYMENEKSNVLKSIMKNTSKNDYQSDNDKTNKQKNQHNFPCIESKGVPFNNNNNNEVEVDNFLIQSIENNNISDSFPTAISDIPDLIEKTDLMYDNELTENKSDNDGELHQNSVSNSNNNDDIKTNDTSYLESNEPSNDKIIYSNIKNQMNVRKSKPFSLNMDHNNSNFHNEGFQKFRHASYFTESVNSRNIVRAKYCSEKSVKHKFFLSENANIESILQDPSDRRIKAVCDKFNCDIDVYSKVIKSGYLKNIVVIAAPNYDCLRKCVRSLDSNMNWCLTCQLTS